MSSQSPVSEQGSSTRASPCLVRHENDLEAAFIYAEDCLRERKEVGHVDYRGDVYDASDHRVGHVTATVTDVGEIYRGYDDRLGHVRVTPNGDGYVYADTINDQLLRGVVTVRGEVYRDGCARKVAIVKPPLDAERMGAAALLLGLL